MPPVEFLSLISKFQSFRILIAMADPGWDNYKSEIERLYIHENMTRDEVVDFMATKHSWVKRQV